MSASDKAEIVVLTINEDAFMAALSRAAERAALAMRRFGLAFMSAQRRHQLRHHRPEVAHISAMHAAYDRRRRARRRR